MFSRQNKPRNRQFSRLKTIEKLEKISRIIKNVEKSTLGKFLSCFKCALIQAKCKTRLSEAGGEGTGVGGLEPPSPIICICIRLTKTLRLEKCEPNSDSLKKTKEPRLALSTFIAHMLQAISDSLFSSIPINSFPNF